MDDNIIVYHSWRTLICMSTECDWSKITFEGRFFLVHYYHLFVVNKQTLKVFSFFLRKQTSSSSINTVQLISSSGDLELIFMFVL